jgi:hypothetical protein
MITFTTTILAMNTVQQPDPNYVVSMLWELTGVDGSFTSSARGITHFDSSAQVGPVTPYSQLTPETVVGWISAADMLNAQQCVQGQLNSLISPPAVPQNTPLPW